MTTGEALPYGRHLIDDDDVAAVVAVLRNGWLTQGPEVAELEERLAGRCNARYGVAVNSGTAALHVALLAAGVGPGDEIVVPAITFLGTANAGVHCGAKPLFTDVDFDTTNMTAELLEPLLSKKTKAVLPVHFAGLPCDMVAIAALVRDRAPNAVILEDACHALGGRHAEGHPVGQPANSEMVMFSFHPVKHVAGGEGGMILTDDEHLAERMRLLRNHGATKDPAMLEHPGEGPWYYEMHEPGYNFRMPDISCALVSSQLSKLEAFTNRRQAIAAFYHEMLSDLPHVQLPEPDATTDSAWHIYVLRIDFEALGRSRTQVMAELRDRGVGTQVHYYPVPLQPYYSKKYGHTRGDFPQAERHYAQALTIPLFPGMTDAQVTHVSEVVTEVLS